MDLHLSSRAPDEVRTDLLVLAAGTDWKPPMLARLARRLGATLTAEIEAQGFRGADGDVALYQTHGKLPARTLLMVGIGAADTVQAWHRLADVVVSRARESNASKAAIGLAAGNWGASAVEAVTEALLLSAYRFEQLKSAPARRASDVRQVLLLTDSDTALNAALTRGRRLAAAACYARDLINLPAAVVTPTYLANEARRIGRSERLRVRIMAVPAMRRAGLGALLGVAQGSTQPPRFIELAYEPHRGKRAQRHIALAGKGITFDSGGLSLKPAESMQSQKRDMAGGAAVLAVMGALRDLGVRVPVRGYIAATENMPGGSAMKPGDVVRAANGKTIEVLNTDAEGRLVLADALSVAAAAKPQRLIDIATLTGAARTALGYRYAAIMGTDAKLVQALFDAARGSGEHLWELPLATEYRGDIDSLVADIKNIGDGSAGTIIGGLFLREFVGTVPWAHIDFSNTATADKPFPGHPRGATGFGVRTLLRYLLALP